MENITELLALIRKEYFSLGVAFFAIQIFIAVVVIAATVFIKKYAEALAILPNLEKKLRIIEDVKQEYYELKVNIELIKDNQAKIFDEERNCLLEYYEEVMERRKDFMLIRPHDLGKRDTVKNIVEKAEKITYEIDAKMITLRMKKIRVGFFVTDRKILSLVDEMYHAVADYSNFIRGEVSEMKMDATSMGRDLEGKGDTSIAIDMHDSEYLNEVNELMKTTEELGAEYVKVAQSYVTNKYRT